MRGTIVALYTVVADCRRRCADWALIKIITRDRLQRESRSYDIKSTMMTMIGPDAMQPPVWARYSLRAQIGRNVQFALALVNPISARGGPRIFKVMLTNVAIFA